MKHPHYFDRTTALFQYDFPIAELIKRYKYGKQLILSHTFSEFLLPHINQHYDYIIAMPLHKKQLTKRGFNQSSEIAKQLSQKTNIPILWTCHKVKDTPPQASLDIKARAKNMHNAFACEEALTAKSILLIDDVMTTGASLNELAKAVRKQGAQKVDCLVIARTI